ncbi:MAG TPA: GNAT family N-acetyltransferase [Usitatibacter sp.]|nr:GNAT family N-acetyltransferase [Usitatibacter sp.]
MAGIALRRLAASDLQSMYLWLGRPHVAKWYGKPPGSFPEMLAKYGPRTEDTCAVRAFIASVEGVDCGYIQAYPLAAFPDYGAGIACESGAQGIDFFIADPWRLGSGLGTRLLRLFLEQEVFAHGAPECFADPGEGNEACIRALEKAGFTVVRQVHVPGSEPQVVLRAASLAQYRLAPIDMGRDLDTCVRLRREAYVSTFGDEAGMEEEMGADNAKYVAYLRARIAELPAGNAHLWSGARIVGQAEMRLVEEDATLGYVNLFYVIPELRRQGLGRLLHRHAVSVFSGQGKRAIRLSVAARNAEALAFYRKLGWRSVGSRPHRETMEVLELVL